MKRVFQCFAALALVVGAAKAQVPVGHDLTGALDQPRGDRPALVLVAGATGRSGRQIVAALLRDPQFAVRGLARDPAAAARNISDKVQWVAGDVTRPATLTAPMKGVTYVLCAIGQTERSGPNSAEFVDFGGVRDLARAARDAGVQQFVLESSMGVESGGFLVWWLNLISGDALVWKKKGEAALRASGVLYTIVRPGGLTDDAGGKTGLSLDQGDRNFGEVSRADVAAVMIAALGNPDATGKTFEVIGAKDAPINAWRSQFRGLAADRPARR